jgi:imidazoleglycerol-phosphate dehydratase
MSAARIETDPVGRTAQVTRTTLETSVRVNLCLDGRGEAKASSGQGFIDHLLQALALYSVFDLDIEAHGDLVTGCHHLFEDLGLALGTAIVRALERPAAICRFGWAIVPMDEVLVQVALDISGRPLAVLDLGDGQVSGVGVEDAREFLRGLAAGMRATIHVDVVKKGNVHHALEAVFKGLGVALRQAVSPDPAPRSVRSTKGSVDIE